MGKIKNFYTKEAVEVYHDVCRQRSKQAIEEGDFYYDHKRDATLYRDIVTRILTEYLPEEYRTQPERGLELGPGTFHFSRELADLGLPIDGVDNSPDMVRKFAAEVKHGYGHMLRVFNQNCTRMALKGRYNHASSHGYMMWIWDPKEKDWIFTSYTPGFERNLTVLKNTAKHLKPGSPFLINVFPHGGDYTKPEKLKISHNRVYICKGMDINTKEVRKHHLVTDSSGNTEWEAVFIKSKFSRKEAEDMIARAGFIISGFEPETNPHWFVARKRLPKNKH